MKRNKTNTYDSGGLPVQHLHYLPFGERLQSREQRANGEGVGEGGFHYAEAKRRDGIRWQRYIDQRAAGTSYNERYTFTGKEKDEETGYGYFGARYMDHDLMTLWLSVDPMADRYIGISPNNYCGLHRS